MPFGKLSLKTTLYLEINFICSCGSYSKAENCLDGTKSEHPDSPETFEKKKKPTRSLENFKTHLFSYCLRIKMHLIMSEVICQRMRMSVCASLET